MTYEPKTIEELEKLVEGVIELQVFIKAHRAKEQNIIEAIGMIRSPEETVEARQWVRNACDYLDDIMRSTNTPSLARQLIDLMKREAWIKTEDAENICYTLGYNPAWVCEDFCPDGVRPLSYAGDKWASWKWDNSQDCFWETDEQPTLLKTPNPPQAEEE